MFNWIKKLLKRDQPEPVKKEIGGFEIMDGFVIGPSYFSQDGKQSSALTCPPIWAFNFGISNSVNRLNKKDKELPKEEFQSLFNSLLDDIIADVLIYFENRLKIIVIKEKLKFKMNSIPECVKAYRALSNIELKDLCDVPFLKAVDRLRGDKHHSHKRYDANYEINGINYDTVDKLKELIKKIKEEVQGVDTVLYKTHPDYEIKTERLPYALQVEWKAVNHALDMTDGGKIVPQRPTVGLDKSQIKYISIKLNFDKKITK